jgi:hypothetical protein
MNIAWVFGTHLQIAPTIDAAEIKNSAPTWGSWKLWRAYQIDNAVCTAPTTAKKLIDQQYHNYCNLYVPHTVDTAGTNVRHFGGSFDQDIADIDDLVAMHLAAHHNDIVLLLGLDFTETADPKYQAILAQTIQTYAHKQWVLVDNVEKINNLFDSMQNFTCDKLQNALQLLL